MNLEILGQHSLLGIESKRMSLHVLGLGLGVQTVTVRVGGGQFLKRFRNLSGLIEKKKKKSEDAKKVEKRDEGEK